MVKMGKVVLMFLGAAFCCVAFARTQDVALWRGETQVFRLQSFAKIGGTPPEGVTMRRGVLRDVDYRESPEALRWQQTTHELYGGNGLDIDRNLRALHKYAVADRVDFSVAEAKGCPKVVEFAVAADAKPGEYLLDDVKLTVVDRVLPPAKEWKYYLDLWQHPWAVARINGLKPFSAEHYEKMRPLWEMLARAGGKALTVTLVDQPWNHQCYDAYGSMVGKTRRADGTWEYDFSLFDEYVAFGRSCGLGPVIACYTMCPWNYLVDWADEKGVVHKEQAKPGTPFFAEYWGAFLPVFAQHLKEKGWFEDAYVAMDERSREDVLAIWNLLKEKAPGLRISMAGDKRPSEMDGIDIACYSQGASHLTPEFLAEVPARRAKGMITTYYVCCWPPRPNTFMSSGAGEAYWCGFYPAIAGLDGILRWAYNSWGEDPMNDMSYDSWLAGDVALVYPDASPSWRFVELRRGIIAAEKFRILSSAGAIATNDLAKLRKDFDARPAILGKVLYQFAEEGVERIVNSPKTETR